MKSIFNNKKFKVLIIAVLAVILVLMFSVYRLSSDGRAYASASNAPTNVELSESDTAAAKAFIDAVDAFPEFYVLQYEHKPLMDDAGNKFKALTANAKTYAGVSEAIDKYEAFLKEFNKKFDFDENDIIKAKAFINAVNLLPGNILSSSSELKYEHKSLLEDAKKKYEALSENVKDYYTGVSDAKEKFDKALKEFSDKFMVEESLITLGKGMLGIFLVMLIIIGCVYLLSYSGNRKKNKKEEAAAEAEPEA